jgi:hypothetical protein
MDPGMKVLLRRRRARGNDTIVKRAVVVMVAKPYAMPERFERSAVTLTSEKQTVRMTRLR